MVGSAKRAALGTRRGGQALPQDAIGQHALERRGHRRRLVPIDEQAVDAVVHDLARAGRARRDDRNAARHRFDQHVAEPFVARGQREDVGARDVLPRVAPGSRRARPRRRDRVAAICSRIAASRSPCPRMNSRAGTVRRSSASASMQQRIVLGVGQPPGRDDHRPRPRRSQRRIERLGRRGRDRRRDRPDCARPGCGAARTPKACDQIVGDALRRRDDRVGEAIADARRPPRTRADATRAPPVVVAIGEKRRHRCLLVEDDARADAARRGPRSAPRSSSGTTRPTAGRVART